MAKVIRCSCGYIARGETDDELVADAQQHAREVHRLEFTREQVLAMAEPEVAPDSGRGSP